MLTACYGQDAKEYYDKGFEQIQAGKFEEAINFFDKSIELNPDVYISWFNRGIAKTRLGLYQDALPDFEQTIKLKPEYKNGYLNRGTAKKHLENYSGAIADYNLAIKLDSNYADAFYNRALVYEILNKKDSSCTDFYKAKQLGSSVPKNKLEICNDTTTSKIVIHYIPRLTKTADNDKYGFTSERPIKVGTGPDGGPANQRAYLNLIRDQQGKPIKYKRLGSCCDYKSENGIFGFAMLDIYEITYLDENGTEKKATVYISFYDYEEPKIIFGFKTVGQQ